MKVFWIRCHNSKEKLCFYYEQWQMKGYCLYLLNNKEAYVQEIVYLDSRALKQMLRLSCAKCK